MVSIDDPSQSSIQINSIIVSASSSSADAGTQINVDWSLEDDHAVTVLLKVIDEEFK
jgi:hypothetical protein